MRITTTDGRVIEADLEWQRGGPENPMSAADVADKFARNAELALGADDVEALQRTVLGLHDAGDLGALEALGRASLAEGVTA